MEYRIMVKPGIIVKPISADLVKVINLANNALRSEAPYRGRYAVYVSADDIRRVVGKDKARDVIVEAISKCNDITLRACGSGWGMFSRMSFDGKRLRVEYRPRAASVLKALLGDSE